MYRFESDYLEGADPQVLQALVDTNSQQWAGYGVDDHCENAKALIRDMAACPDAAVHFVVGGTQANLTVIASGLRPWEGVLCANTGHINVHETGAIEATGHKVLALPGREGKISAQQVAEAVRAHREDATHEHMVKPAMVYISHPTEEGTLYTRQELSELSAVCRDSDLFLFVDGARLGYGLAAEPEVDMPFLAKVCDVFTIGGTKAGLLFGEAIVLTSGRLADSFRYGIKQRGGMLAKGRLLGVQFEALLKDGYYVDICGRANALAQRMKKAFVAHGCALLCDTRANQIFPIITKTQMEKLEKECSFSFWCQVDENSVAVRFCASVTTTEAAVEHLERVISQL